MGKKTVLLQGVTILVTLFFGALQPALAVEEPSFKIGQGVAVTPVGAMTYYGGATTRSASPGSPIYPPEFISLAKALGSEAASNDPGGYLDRVYSYVRNSINTEPMFGSAKGLLGTILDHSGTAFDQTELMVELLRYGGISADYQLVDATHSATDTANWLGFQSVSGTFDQSALQAFLADAAIPHTTSGASVTILQPIVRATFGGQSYLFDPSYKLRQHKTGVTLVTAMNYSRTTLEATAQSGVITGSASGVATSKGFNASGIDSQLAGFSGSLLNWIQTNKPVSDMEDILGGGDVIEEERPVNGWRQTSISYIGTPRLTWSGTTRIPDQYRKRINFRLDAEVIHAATLTYSSVVLFDGTQNFFMDEVYGHRLWVDTDPDLYNFQLNLKVDNTTVQTVTMTQPGGTNPLHLLNRAKGKITLTINHPYAGNAGAYMDKSTNFQAWFVEPFTLVVGTGSTSPAIASKHNSEVYGQRQYYPYVHYMPEGENISVIDYGPYFKSDTIKTQIGDSWLEQTSRMYDLQARVGNGAIVQHHSLGVAYSIAKLKVVNQQNSANNFTNFYQNGSIDGEWHRLSVDTSVSARSVTGDTATQGAIRQSIAAAAATLEGSAFEQSMDAVDSATTATRFAWANNFGESQSCANLLSATCPSPNPLAYSLSNGVGTDITGFTGPEEIGYRTLEVSAACCTLPLLGMVANALGPGTGSKGPIGTIELNNYGRGPAWVSTKEDLTEFRHIIVDQDSDARKGSGGAADPTASREYDIKKTADILKDTFEDRSNLHGVSLATGEFSLSQGPDLTIGKPDSVGALTFERYFSGGGGATYGLPDGWTHNWDISLQISGSGAEAMGSRQVIAGVASLVAFQTMQDLYKAGPLTLNNQVEALLVNDWWRRQLSNNVASFRWGKSLEQFVRVPTATGDTWLPPAGSGSSVTISGNRVVNADSGPTFSRAWKYSAVTASWRSANDDVITFALKDRPKFASTALSLTNSFVSNGGGHEAYFLPTSLLRANGQSITFTYNTDGGNLLTKISNSFGRELTLTYASSLTNGSIRPLVGVSDSAGQSITLTTGQLGANSFGNQGVTLSTVTLPGGRTSKYEYVGNGVSWTGAPANPRLSYAPRLRQYFDPNQMVKSEVSRVATLLLDYDENWSTTRIYDAQAIFSSATRGPYRWSVTKGNWAARTDPAGGVYQVYYDSRGRSIRFVDEIGRTTGVSYDGWGRVARRALPEGNVSAFTYDFASNIIGSDRFGKPNGVQPGLHASGAYDPTFNKPTSITDFNNNTTTLSYVQSGNGRGEVLRVTQPSIDAGQPRYDYTYNALGLVDTMTMRITGSLSTVSKYTYDSYGNLTREVSDYGGLNLVKCYTYDTLGNQTGTSDGRDATCLA